MMSKNWRKLEKYKNVIVEKNNNIRLNVNVIKKTELKKREEKRKI